MVEAEDGLNRWLIKVVFASAFLHGRISTLSVRGRLVPEPGPRQQVPGTSRPRTVNQKLRPSCTATSMIYC